MTQRLCKFFLVGVLFLQSFAEASPRRELTIEDKKSVIQLGKKLFSESSFGQMLMRQHLVSQLKEKTVMQSIGQALKSGGAMSAIPLGFTVELTYSAAANLMQAAFMSAFVIGAMANDFGCQHRNLRDVSGCEDLSVRSHNAQVLAEYLGASGEFYTSLATGFAANEIVNRSFYLLLKNSEGLSFTKNLMMSGPASVLAYFGPSFGSALWKVVMLKLTDEEKARAEGLMGRIFGFSSDYKSDDNLGDKQLFGKIWGLITDIFLENKELRSLLLFNWWRFELATGKGVSGIVSQIPSILYMQRSMNMSYQAASAGKKVGGGRGMLIGFALGVMGALIAADLPDEWLHQITNRIQDMRSRIPLGSLYPNESEIKRILKYYKESNELQTAYGIKNKSRMADRINPLKPSAEVNENYIKQVEKLILQRRAIREDYASIVYEKVFASFQEIFMTNQNMIVAKAILDDLEVSKAMSRVLTLNKDGQFILNEDDYFEPKDPQSADCNKNYLYIFPSINRCKSPKGDYQKSVLEKGEKKIKFLKEFMSEEVEKLTDFYKKEVGLFVHVVADYRDVADFNLMNRLIDERDWLNKLVKTNENILFGLLDMDKISQSVSGDLYSDFHFSSSSEKRRLMNELTEDQKIDLAYLKVVEKITTKMRDEGYTEEKMLKESDK